MCVLYMCTSAVCNVSTMCCMCTVCVTVCECVCALCGCVCVCAVCLSLLCGQCLCTVCLCLCAYPCLLCLCTVCVQCIYVWDVSVWSLCVHTCVAVSLSLSLSLSVHVCVPVSLCPCVCECPSPSPLPAVVPSGAHHELVVVREADVGDVRRVPKVPLVFGLWDRTAAQGWHQAKLCAHSHPDPKAFSLPGSCPWMDRAVWVL